MELSKMNNSHPIFMAGCFHYLPPAAYTKQDFFAKIGP
jgi:hypothetical protein